MSTPWNPFKVATTTHNTFLSLRERNPWHPFIVDQNTFYLPPLFLSLSLSLSLSHTHTHTLSLSLALIRSFEVTSKTVFLAKKIHQLWTLKSISKNIVKNLSAFFTLFSPSKKWRPFLLFSFHFDRDKTDLNTFQLVQSRSLLSTVNFPPLPAKFINLNNLKWIGRLHSGKMRFLLFSTFFQSVDVCERSNWNRFTDDDLRLHKKVFWKMRSGKRLANAMMIFKNRAGIGSSRKQLW